MYSILTLVVLMSFGVGADSKLGLYQKEYETCKVFTSFSYFNDCSTCFCITGKIEKSFCTAKPCKSRERFESIAKNNEKMKRTRWNLSKDAKHVSLKQKACEVFTSFLDSDDCNKCVCLDGNPEHSVCALKVCSSADEYNKIKPERPRSLENDCKIFTSYSEECNKCYCFDGNIENSVCTAKKCIKHRKPGRSENDRLHSEKSVEPKQHFI